MAHNHQQSLKANICAYFEALGSYVILRNHNIDESLNRGGDIDVLVDDIIIARNLLFELFGKPLFSLRRTYVESYFYKWGHIDLTPRIEWRGSIYLSNSALLKGAQRSTFGFAKPRLADEALICWFASLIWGGFFKERYSPVISQAALCDGEYFLRALTYAVGPKLGASLLSLARQGKCSQSASMVKSLRRSLWLRGFTRRPLGTLVGLVSHYMREISLRTRPPAPWFAILGLDGSGKSTLVSGLQQRFQQMGLRTIVYHWRPHIIRPKKQAAEPVKDPHGLSPRGSFLSIGKLLDLLFDWLVGSYGAIANQRAKGNFVVFDRYYADLLADPLRYRYGGPVWLTRLILAFLPKPDAVILLDSDPETLRQRKQEVTLDAAKLIRAQYLRIIGGIHAGYIVDAAQPASHVLDSSFNIILNTTCDRTQADSITEKP
jgi:thymidylate kinase